MTVRLSLRKRAKKLIANSRGFSSVIGTTFMVLVMLFLSTSVFMWTLSQNTMYNQAVRERNQMDIDRSNERITALGVNYTVSGNEVRVEVTLANEGPISVQIITLWVLDTTIQKYGFNNTLNLNLNPGDTLNLAGTNAIMVTIVGSGTLHQFNSWFVTARGNTVPLERERGIIVAQLAQGIGSLALDFYTFRYFEYETDPPNKLKNYPAGNASFAIPHGKPIAFGIVLTNLDPSKQSITFDKYSQVWLYCPEAIGAFKAEPPVWYIVNVNEDNGTIQASYSEIPINYGDAKLIIFASETADSFSKVQLTKEDYANKLFAVNLMLHGKLVDRDYGQNIPFVSLYCYET